MASQPHRRRRHIWSAVVTSPERTRIVEFDYVIVGLGGSGNAILQTLDTIVGDHCSIAVLEALDRREHKRARAWPARCSLPVPGAGGDVWDELAQRTGRNEWCYSSMQRHLLEAGGYVVRSGVMSRAALKLVKDCALGLNAEAGEGGRRVVSSRDVVPLGCLRDHCDRATRHRPRGRLTQVHFSTVVTHLAADARGCLRGATTENGVVFAAARRLFLCVGPSADHILRSSGVGIDVSPRCPTFAGGRMHVDVGAAAGEVGAAAEMDVGHDHSARIRVEVSGPTACTVTYALANPKRRLPALGWPPAGGWNMGDDAMCATVEQLILDSIANRKERTIDLADRSLYKSFRVAAGWHMGARRVDGLLRAAGAPMVSVVDAGVFSRDAGPSATVALAYKLMTMMAFPPLHVSNNDDDATDTEDDGDDDDCSDGGGGGDDCNQRDPLFNRTTDAFV